MAACDPWKLKLFCGKLEAEQTSCCGQREGPCAQTSDFSMRYLQYIQQFFTVLFLPLLMQQEICLSIPIRRKRK